MDKSIILSKTFWVNLIVAALAFVPAAQSFMQNNPELVLTGFSLVNIVLRFITKDKVYLA